MSEIVDSPPTPPVAPPTRPGPIPPRDASITNRNAIGSMVCGFFGFIVPLVNVAAIVLGFVGIVQIRRRAPRESGTAYAVVGICAGVLGIGVNMMIALIVVSVVGVSRSGLGMNGPSPTLVQQASLEYAAQYDRYPDHVAELMLAQGAPLASLVLERRRIGAPGVLMVGEYDTGRFNYTEAHEARLREALDGLDAGDPVYRYGQVWFVRLGTPRSRDDLVAAWSVNGDGDVQVVFDDGSDRVDVTDEEWPEIWTDDAEARVDLDMPALEPPKIRVAIGEVGSGQRSAVSPAWWDRGHPVVSC